MGQNGNKCPKRLIEAIAFLQLDKRFCKLENRQGSISYCSVSAIFTYMPENLSKLLKSAITHLPIYDGDYSNVIDNEIKIYNKDLFDFLM